VGNKFSLGRDLSRACFSEHFRRDIFGPLTSKKPEHWASL
jgi:hypothetical protein